MRRVLHLLKRDINPLPQRWRPLARFTLSLGALLIWSWMLYQSTADLLTRPHDFGWLTSAWFVLLVMLIWSSWKELAGNWRY